MTPFQIATIVIYSIDLILITGMIFLERKDPRSFLLWAILFVVVPIISWLLYLLIGKGPNISRGRWSRKKKAADKMLQERLSNERVELYLGDTEARKQIVNLNLNYGESPCFCNNSVEFFIDAHEMYERQLEDIKNAKKSINIMYYLFKPDAAGKMFRDALTEKAKEGIQVNLIYDSSGNLKTRLSFFKKLIAAGGKVRPFFPSVFKFINNNFCYRNHRKIVVIDGEIGYVGGMNIGVDYLSQDKRIKPWRDTHLRITGESVTLLQTRFIKDFTCSNKNPMDKKDIDNFFKKDFSYFPSMKECGDSPVQIISSGPDTTKQEIKFCYKKIIQQSTKEVYLESPYFIPDDSFIESIILAQASGVQVHLIIPKVWDKKLVYHVTISNLEEVLKAGAKVYLYPGFIHSKMVVGDTICASIGTANLDVRSFALNFEVNAVLYKEEDVIKARDICRADIAKSEELTYEKFKKRSLWNRFFESILRLFSPLM